MIHQLVILGSGPAGLTSALYSARAQLSPLVLHGQQPGGQLTTTSIIENFPGFPEGIDGSELIDRMQKQAETFGATFHYGQVVSVKAGSPHKLTLSDGSTIETQALIIATGAQAQRLGLPAEEIYWGKGVSTCATCDGFFYKGQAVAVVGGGDSASEEALYLTRMCSKVYLIHRRDQLRASRIMADRVTHHPKIECVWDSVITNLAGTSALEEVEVQNVKTGECRALAVTGLFVAIGHKPATDLFRDLLDRDDNGYLVLSTPNSTSTKVEGIFVAGDCADHKFRQAITASGTGCMASMEAERWLESKGV